MRWKWKQDVKGEGLLPHTDVAELHLQQGPQGASLGTVWSAGGRLGPIHPQVLCSLQPQICSSPRRRREITQPLSPLDSGHVKRLSHKVFSSLPRWNSFSTTKISPRQSLKSNKGVGGDLACLLPFLFEPWVTLGVEAAKERKKAAPRKCPTAHAFESEMPGGSFSALYRVCELVLYSSGIGHHFYDHRGDMFKRKMVSRILLPGAMYLLSRAHWDSIHDLPRVRANLFRSWQEDAAPMFLTPWRMRHI